MEFRNKNGLKKEVAK